MTASYADLHPWQRHLCHIHGYAEGWAHYAEQLADELGLIRDPAERLGLLLGQIWRSVRIVADIGLHTGWAIPPNHLVVESTWSPELAQRMLVDLALVEAHLAGFEVTATSAGPGRRSPSGWVPASGTRPARLGPLRTATPFRCASSTATRSRWARWDWSRCAPGCWVDPSAERRSGRSSARELRQHLAAEQRDALG
jgi:hypothetical protein